MGNFVEKWGVFEVSFEGPRNGNPYIDVNFGAIFKHEGISIKVNGFYDGDGIYKVRFMPNILGQWTFITESNVSSLRGLRGSFVCVEPSKKNHGPVKVKDKFYFEYSDGTPYHPFGTTCYAWIHQPLELQEKTLETLKSSPFNKLRMCVFPKHYEYNYNEPILYPFEGSLDRGFDFSKYNPEFFRHLEKRILDLQEMGIECDLILFHPYDRWGFSKMGVENDDRYVKYIVSRLSSFRNIWWSMANEYDLMEFLKMKNHEDWDRLAKIVQENDPYGHLISIHNWKKFYDFNKQWVTHCSIQRIDVYKTSENTDKWRRAFNKPIVIDECAYEGNIEHGWGNITGEEMTRRVWEGVVRGGYVGHGETYVHPKDILWWAHGGELHGTSYHRIGFLKRIIEEAPGNIQPIENTAEINPYWDVAVGSVGEDYYIFYFGFNQPSFRTFHMPKDKKYYVDIIDTWNMTIKRLPGLYSGDFRIDLPGKQYIAVRMIKAG